MSIGHKSPQAREFRRETEPGQLRRSPDAKEFTSIMNKLREKIPDRHIAGTSKSARKKGAPVFVSLAEPFASKEGSPSVRVDSHALIEAAAAAARSSKWSNYEPNVSSSR